MTAIPQISLKELKAGNHTNKLANACRDWGFFRLVDHGINADTEQAFMATSRSFFAMEGRYKTRFSRSSENPWGYYDRELTKNRQDWKEIFDLGIDQHGGGYSSRTPWPDKPDEFRTVMLDWYHRCEDISLALLDAISRGLGQPPARLRGAFSPTSSSFLRLNHYPVCETPADPADDYPEAGHLGIHHHTDAGALTVLLQDDVAGLQVRHQGAWHTVETVPGTLIINVGDLVQLWSNDEYEAPLHRVLASRTADRYSAAYFFNPTFDTDCLPLTGGTPRYRLLNWGEFRAKRAAGDYANLGAEVQLSDYRL